MAVKPTPEGYRTITPYLIVDGAAQAIEFYKQVFGAETAMKPFTAPGGKIGHAELRIGDCHIMLADEYPEMGAKAPKRFGGSPIQLMVYVKDVDGTVKAAAAAGAKITRPVENQFYGDRSGQIEDPFGHSWTIATHIEDVSEAEAHRRAQEKFGHG